MGSVCLPFDAFLQHIPSYLGCQVSLHGCSSKVQPLLLILDKGYLLTAAFPDLQRGIAPLGPPSPAQPPLLRCGVAPAGRPPWPRTRGISPRPFLRRRSLALSRYPWPRTWGNSSWPPLLGHGVLPASAPDLGRGVAPLGHACARA